MTEVWMHKETGQIATATSIYISAGDETMLTGNQRIEDVPFVVSIGGAFQDIGYMITNEHMVCVFLPHEAKDYFEVLGEL